MGERAYLRPDARRRQLLDAASRLFDQGGFTAVTVSAVAAEAGASRRLVYDHFADLAELIAVFFEARVAGYAERIDAAAASSTGQDQGLVGATTELMAVPPEDLRAIALVLADGATPELAGARATLREHLRTRWLPALTDLGVTPDLATALMWTLATAFVGLADQAHHGDVAPESAEAVAAAIAASLPDVVERIARPSISTTSDREPENP